jgi:hypothetical protein
MRLKEESDGRSENVPPVDVSMFGSLKSIENPYSSYNILAPGSRHILQLKLDSKAILTTHGICEMGGGQNVYNIANSRSDD